MRYYVVSGLGNTPPLGPGMVDCGGGLSVRADLPCPDMTPIDLTTPAAIAAQAEWHARNARCQVYQRKEYAIDVGVGLLAAIVLPGWWSLLALPIAVMTEAYYPRSEDCNYGW